MKILLAITLIICIMASAFSLPASAADLSTSNAAFQLYADKASASTTDAIFNESYIALAIAVIGLVASVVSVILLVADRKKEDAKSKEKESDENSKKNNK